MDNEMMYIVIAFINLFLPHYFSPFPQKRKWKNVREFSFYLRFYLFTSKCTLCQSPFCLKMYPLSPKIPLSPFVPRCPPLYPRCTPAVPPLYPRCTPSVPRLSPKLAMKFSVTLTLMEKLSYIGVYIFINEYIYMYIFFINVFERANL